MKLSRHPWFPAAVIAAGLAALLGAGQWARIQVAERDKDILWLWAYSPRTMQTYLVRATPADGGISFRLESEVHYVFRDCAPGTDEAPCLDQNNDSWTLSQD